MLTSKLKIGILFVALLFSFISINSPANAEPKEIIHGAIAEHENIFNVTTREEFVAKVEQKSLEHKVFVFVHADWCGYCNLMTPVFIEEFLKMYPDQGASLAIMDVTLPDQTMQMLIVEKLFDYAGTPHGGLYVEGKLIPVPIYMMESVVKAKDSATAQKLMHEQIVGYLKQPV